MRNKAMKRRISLVIVSIIMACSMVACGNNNSTSSSTMDSVVAESTQTDDEESNKLEDSSSGDSSSDDSTSVSIEGMKTDGMIDTTDMFTDRDLEQTADLSDAESFTLSDGEDITITSEGVYIISGEAKNVTIYVEAGDDDKVQIVLDGANITNDSDPCIYVKSGDKVFVTTTDSDNSLAVTGTYVADGDTNLDAVLFSKEDLVINGLGTLNISSTDNGITSKDTLKITGSTLNISSSGNALEAHDAIEIAAGTINVTECNDGLHAEDNDDDSTGYIYICGGTLSITAADDAIHATTIVQIDDGSFTLNAGECIEGTYIQINGGDIDITASDDGINAANKSSAYNPTVEINDGNVKITMGAGDTDGIDSNGDIIINGGTVDISGQFTFDYDGTAEFNGGTIIENGTEVDTITNQFMGGGPGGDMEGFPGGDMTGGPGASPDGDFEPPADGEFKTPPDGEFTGEQGTHPKGGMKGGPKQDKTTETTE